MRYLKVSSALRFWPAGLLILVMATACERALAPVRSAVQKPVYGDFAFDFDSISVPDTVALADSIPVRFWAPQGQDPCAFVGNMWTTGSRVVVTTLYGVTRQLPTCHAPTINLPIPGLPSHAKAFPGDTLIEPRIRVIVCQAHGPPLEKTVAIAVPEPSRLLADSTYREPTAKDAERMCRMSTGYISTDR